MKYNKSFLNILVLTVFFVLFLILYLKLEKIEGKVEKTNKLLYRQEVLKSVDQFNTINTSDIFIGDVNDTNTVVVYLKYGCEACSDFYKKTIKNGLSKNHKVILRFLAHPSREKRFDMTVGAYASFQKGNLTKYLDSIFFGEDDYSVPKIDLAPVDMAIIKNYIIKTAQQARSFGVKSTPTTFYKGERYTGSIGIEKLSW